MKKLTLDEHRNRIININEVNARIIDYRRRLRISDYLPGQVTYNLGDYPARFTITPNEYDFNLLKKFSEDGVQLIQIHEEWNDSIRLYGADKYSSHDPNGMKQFVDLCHYFGIKIIPYVSSGYIHEYDSDYRSKFSKSDSSCIGIHFSYRKGNPGCAEWRDFIIPKSIRVLDTYGFDGLYNDWGYDYFYLEQHYHEVNRHVINAHNFYDPEVEDLLYLIYSAVKERDGIYKLHADRYNEPPCKDRVYDYLWIGESVSDLSTHYESLDYKPYIVPCEDKKLIQKKLDYYYAVVIPLVQFPLLIHGRPMTGEKVEVEGIHYYGIDNNKSLYWYYKRIGEHVRKHPDQPVYSEWSNIPDNPNEYEVWSKYLKLYRPMVTEGSIAFADITKNTFIKSIIEPYIHVSIFVNEKIYLAASNLSNHEYELVLDDIWIDRLTGVQSNTFKIAPECIIFLNK